MNGRAWKRVIALGICLALALCGVAVAEEGARMGVALVDGVHAAFNGDGAADVHVLGMDELLAGAEFDALENLDPVDMVLVTLLSLGLDEEVSVACTERDVALSEDADLLQTAIYERALEMGEEELAARNAQMLDLFFPDGGARITLVYEMSDGSSRTENYAFVATDDGYVLDSVTVE